MIISRTPLRMSFVGGGSDLPAFYHRHPGAVVSTAINKYVYVTVNPKFDDRIRVSYSRTEETHSVRLVRHPLVRESLRALGLKGGIEITSVADIPSHGTGLGSSSSFTVGLLHALHAFQGQYRSAADLAQQACHIELDLCREPIGKQDQYAAAYGGFNFIEFFPDNSVSIQPILCRPDTLRRLERNLLVFYAGGTRSASSILRDKQKHISKDPRRQDALLQMTGLACQLKDQIQQNRLDAFGDILHQNWLLKKSLAGRVSNDRIDRLYHTARKHGALGGKLLGAGAGGFLLFYVPRKHQRAVTHALHPLRRIDFRFEPLGSRIIFVH